MGTARQLCDRWRALPPPVRTGVRVVVALAVAGALLAPNVSDVGRALDAAGSVNAVLLTVGVAFAVAAMASLAMLTRTTLPPGGRPPILTMVRIELSAMAASHTIPGGTAAGTALGFTLLHQAGVSKADAGFAVGVRGVGSSLVLNALLWLALAISIPRRGLDPVYLLVSLVGLVIAGTVAVVAFFLVRRRAATRDRLTRASRRLPLVSAAGVPETVDHLADRLAALGSDRWLMARVTAWSASYWLFDAAALFVFVSAFGETPPPDALMVAFAVGNLVAFIPLTPRGLGTLEATVITLLGALGVARASAVLGVLGWRLVNFWAPIPVGGLSYASLRVWPPSVD